MKGYGTHLHLLRVVLYHRGQMAAEPRKKWYVVPERPVLKPRMEETMERYLANRRPTSRPNTIYRAQSGLRAFALWMARAYPEISSFAEVEREHVLEYAAELAEGPHPKTGKPIAPTTLRGRISVLSVFRDTADWGWDDVPGRPLLGFGDLPKVPQTAPRYIPDEELARLMDAIRELECPFQRAALLVARWSGARRDEIRRLELGCLDPTSSRPSWSWDAASDSRRKDRVSATSTSPAPSSSPPPSTRRDCGRGEKGVRSHRRRHLQWLGA